MFGLVVKQQTAQEVVGSELRCRMMNCKKSDSASLVYHIADGVPGADLVERPRNAAAEKTIELGIDDRVAFAGRLFKPLTVEDRDSTSCILDELFGGELLRCERYAFTPDAKHIRDKVVGHDEVVVEQAVVAEQQPPAKLLFDRVQPVADSGL